MQMKYRFKALHFFGTRMKVDKFEESSSGGRSVLAEAGVRVGQDPGLDGGHSSVDTWIWELGTPDAPGCYAGNDRSSVYGGNHWA